MKQAYYTEQNIDSKSKEFLNELKININCKNIKLEPEKSALLVLDMQEYFLNQSSHAYIPSAKAIIPKLKNLISLFLNANRPIIYTKHINSSENAAQMGTWWKELISKDNPLCMLSHELAGESRNSIIVTKTQYDAFYNTNLEEILKENNVSQVVTTGVMTHLCCETTIRSAFVRGLTSFFPIDGTATYNENFHKASFLTLSHGFSVPVIIDDIKRDFEDDIVANR